MGHFFSKASLSLLLACSALQLGACAESSVVAPTQVTLLITGTDEVITEAQTVRVSFHVGNGMDPSNFQDAGDPEVFGGAERAPGWPLSMALVRESDNESFQVTIVAEDADGNVVAKAVRLTAFEEGGSKLLQVVLARLPAVCEGACDEHENCDAADNEAVCTAPEFTPPDELPEFEAPDGDTDGGGEDAAVTGGDGAVDAGADAMSAPSCSDDQAPDCGDHGVCDVAGDTLRCACDAGYAGSLCDACDVGFGADASDRCVSLCELPEAPDCGAEGSCVVEEDSALCECVFPAAGETCTECATGYERVDGVCEPNCGGCPAHSFCSTATTVPGCACVVGYTDQTDDEMFDCAWEGSGANGGGLLDNFIGDESVWDASRTTFDEDALEAGNGTATHTVFGLCGGSSFGQDIQMPSVSTAEPFALRIAFQSNAGGGFDSCDHGAELKVGKGLAPIDFPSATGEVDVCLGGNAYGEDVTMAVVPEVNVSRCVSGNTPCDARSFISLEIVPSDTCDLPFGIPDAEFTNGGAGWDFSATSGKGSAGVTGGEAVLDLYERCSSARMSTQISFPKRSEVPHAALRFRQRAEGDETLGVTLNGRRWFGIRGEGGGAERVATHCVPPWAAGMAYELEFEVSTSGLCADDPFVRYEFDDFEFVSDPTCGTFAGELDAGFERAEFESPWSVTSSASAANASLYVGAAEAHSGNQAFRVVSPATTGTFNGTARANVRMPPLGENAAFKFWHRASQNPGSYNGASVSVAGGAFMNFSSELSTAWTQSVLCLDPVMSGSLGQIIFTYSKSSTPGDTFWVDDVSIEDDPVACP